MPEPEVKVKLKMPMIPLRDVVIFPNSVSTLFVGREKSIYSLEDALRSNKKIFLIAQNSPSNEEPNLNDLPRVGTISSLLQMIKLPDGTVKILVEGVQRATLENVNVEKGYFAEIKKIPNDISDSKYEKDLLSTIKTQFTEFVSVSKKVSFEIINQVESMGSLGKAVDVIASNIHLSISDKQQILEKTNSIERAEFLSSLLEAQIDLTEVEQRIRGRVRKQMEKSQKEYFLNEQIKAAQKELGEIGEEKNELDEIQKKIEATKLSKDALEKVNSEFSKLKQMSPMSAEATVVRTYIETLLEVPWSNSTKINLDLKRAKSVLDTDHYGLKEIKDRILEYLAVQKRVKKMKAPVLCFVGPPGVGKTSLGESIARSVNRDFIRLSLGGVRDEAEIRGHRKTYIGSMPGKIIQKLTKVKVKNPLFLLDEVDKVGMDQRGDPSSALLEVLDPEQNNTFNDHYLEVDYDLSDMMFLTTANSLRMPPALLDRMEIIRIAGYTEDEKLEIAKQHLIPEIEKKHGLKKDEITIKDSAIIGLIRHYTREAGVRSLEREISNLARKTIKKIVAGECKSQTINGDNLPDFAGIKKFKYGEIDSDDQVGIVTGLAWTEVGGEILQIESVIMPGKGKMTITGKLGDVMKESIHAAQSYVRSRAIEFGIKPTIFNQRDIHIHVPEGAIPKDGPSAGLGMVTSIVSVLTGVPVRKDIAMTGEVTLRGKALPIGGLKEKLLAALRAGTKTVLIPKRMKKI